MKVFDFEQNLKKENENNVNIIYKYKNGTFAISTLKGRSNLNEVLKGERVVYNSLDELIEKSEQFSKFETFNSFLVDTSKNTDASKWEVTKIFTIRKIKNKLNITDDDIAEMFNYKSKMAYANSSAKNRIENGLVKFYTTITRVDG